MRNRLIVTIFLCFTSIFAVSCKKKQYLTGYYNWDQFCQRAEWDVFVDEKYKPKTVWMDSIQNLKVSDSLHLKIFLGTYCHDSKKWVPRFYKIKDQLPVSGIEIISVDTTKKDAKGLWKEVKLEKIPTFVFYNRAGMEVGRIVEKPKGGLEKCLFAIFKKV